MTLLEPPPTCLAHQREKPAKLQPRTSDFRWRNWNCADRPKEHNPRRWLSHEL